MPRRTIHRLAHRLDRELDRRLGDRRVTRRVSISPYRGFGREDELIARGRVLVERGITRATDAESVWRNLLNTYRRFASDEVAGARVLATWRDTIIESRSDDEGYFEIRIGTASPASLMIDSSGTGAPPDMRAASVQPGAEVQVLVAPQRKGAWHEVRLELPDHGASAPAHVLVPAPDAAFGVISDIDDTLVQTNATSLPRMIRSIVRNAASRLPFEGVAELYRALHVERNPIFYVSSSPWNLYEVLHDYMDINGIPHGPMFLQDWGVDEQTLILDAHTDHKLEQIGRLVEYYPSLPFVLIGDSGQHDPEIYLQVIQAHPGRILAAFIRDVTPDLRDRAVAAILEQSNAAGVEMLYVRDSAEALTHARRLGLATPPVSPDAMTVRLPSGD